MSERRRSVSVTPEPDDFAARYDRMVEAGAAPWLLRTLLAVVGVLLVVGLLGYLLGS